MSETGGMDLRISPSEGLSAVLSVWVLERHDCFSEVIAHSVMMMLHINYLEHIALLHVYHIKCVGLALQLQGRSLFCLLPWYPLQTMLP